MNFFDIPTLYGISRTAPYFHDNSAATLEDTVIRYQLDFQLLRRVIPAMAPWPLRPDLIEDDEIAQFVAYLKKLGQPDPPIQILTWHTTCLPYAPVSALAFDFVPIPATLSQTYALLAGEHNVMQLPIGIMIEPLDESGCDEFFLYLNDHRSENGNGESGYFMPRSQSESRFPAEKEKPFRDGLNVPVGSPDWRRGWVARVAHRQIVGHIDLWSHPVRFAEHRCLLGMGVHRNHRRLGLGAALLSHAIEWVLAKPGLEWLDLHVLSTNEPAIRLYLRAGFSKVGEMAEMFKFDGRLFSDTMMTKRLRQAQNGNG